MSNSMATTALVGLLALTQTVQVQARPRYAEPASSSIHAMIARSAAAHGVPYRIADGVARVESGYRCGVRNGGIMQIRPRTAASVGIRGNLQSCAVGIEAGMRYLAQALHRFGPGCAGISAYNIGLGSHGRCTAYGRRVLGGSRS